MWGAFKGSDLVAAAKVHRKRSQTFESSRLNASLFTTPEQWRLQVVSKSKLFPIGVDPEQDDERDGSPCSGGARAISHRSQKGSTEWNGTTSGLSYPEHWRLSSAWKHCRKRCLSPWLPPLERPLLDEWAPLHANILLPYNIIAKQETCGCMHRFKTWGLFSMEAQYLDETIQRSAVVTWLRPRIQPGSADYKVYLYRPNSTPCT